MLDPDEAMAYLDFVVERHRVWEARQRGDSQPWTEDTILASRKFTNVFRVLDPGSQFFVTDLASGPPEQVLFRAYLYRFTNLPDPWIAYASEFGGYPAPDDIEQAREFWCDYQDQGNLLFSGAYVINGGNSNNPGVQKIKVILDMIRDNLIDGPTTQDYIAAGSVQERLDVLRRIPFCADFMAMQITTDYGYWDPTFTEDDVILMGPGAKRGALALDPHGKPLDTHRWAVDAVRSLEDCPTLPGGRKPSWMDIQNTLCEWSKYVRFRGRGTVVTRAYQPAHPGPQDPPVLPEHYS